MDVDDNEIAVVRQPGNRWKVIAGGQEFLCKSLEDAQVKINEVLGR